VQGKYPVREVRGRRERSDVPTEFIVLQKMAKGLSGGDADVNANTDAKANTDSKDKSEVHDPFQAMMKDARSRETQYGPGVKFVSATPVKTETMIGYKAIYAFKDINNLRINQNPKNKTGMPDDSQDKSRKKEEIIRFKLVKGPISTLTVTMPEKTKDDKAADDVKQDKRQNKDEMDPNSAEIMKMFFKDMSMKLVLDIDGTIIDTNATYRDKSRLTLFDMHFGKIIENVEVFEKLNATQPKTIAEMKELVKGMEGLKIEMNNPGVVSFE
jgi:hypothetical protein